MAVGLNADADILGYGPIPAGGAGSLSGGAFSSFFVGGWVYRPSVGNSAALTSEGYMFGGLSSAREIKVGFDNTFGAGDATGPLLHIIFNAAGGTGATPTLPGANIFDEWVYYFFCADAANQYAGYIRWADLGNVITASLTRANDNAGSQFITNVGIGNYAGGGFVVMGNYAYWRARDGNHNLSNVMAFAQSDAPIAGDWAFWALPSASDLTDSSGNGRHLGSAGTLTTEASPVIVLPPPRTRANLATFMKSFPKPLFRKHPRA